MIIGAKKHRASLVIHEVNTDAASSMLTKATNHYEKDSYEEAIEWYLHAIEQGI